MVKTGDIVIRRILVALDTSSRGAAAAQAAAELAAAAQVDLFGLFVEDINLLKLAGLPFARELGLASACSRPLDFAEVERALRAQAAEVEQLLARAAQRQQLRWSFQVTRGQVVAEVLSTAQDEDLVVLGKVGRSIAARLRGPGKAGTGDEMVPARRPVLLVFDGSDPSFRALQIAARMARNASLAQVLMITAVGKDYQRLHQGAEDCLEPGISRVRWHAIKGDAATMARAARRERAEIVVLAVPPDSRSAEKLIDSLLEAMECPLVLVR